MTEPSVDIEAFLCRVAEDDPSLAATLREVLACEASRRRSWERLGSELGLSGAAQPGAPSACDDGRLGSLRSGDGNEAVFYSAAGVAFAVGLRPGCRYVLRSGEREAAVRWKEDGQCGTHVVEGANALELRELLKQEATIDAVPEPVPFGHEAPVRERGG